MLSFVQRHADLIHDQSESRLDGVEQARFAHAARAGHGADLAHQARFEFVHPFAGLGRSIDHRITERLIGSENFLGVFNEINFIGNDQDGHLLFFRNDQEPVEHS